MTVNRLILMAVLVATTCDAKDNYGDWSVTYHPSDEMVLEVRSWAGSYAYVRIPAKGEGTQMWVDNQFGSTYARLYDRPQGTYLGTIGGKYSSYSRIDPAFYDHLGKNLYCKYGDVHDVKVTGERWCAKFVNATPQPQVALDQSTVNIDTYGKLWTTPKIRLTSINARKIDVKSEKPVTLNLKTRKLTINPGSIVSLTVPQSEGGRTIVGHLDFTVSGTIPTAGRREYFIRFETSFA